MVLRRKNIESFFLVILYLTLILVGLKEFKVWPQITSLIDQEITTIELYEQGHPHWSRYSLFAPLLEMKDLFGIELDFLFSLLCPLLLLINGKFLSKALHKRYISPLLLFFLIFISLFMNGRGVILLCSSSLFIYSTVTFSLKGLSRIFLLLVALYLSTVSSGAFYVILLSTVIFFLIRGLKNSYFITGIIIVLITVFPLAEKFFIKNLEYFDFSFAKMLNHSLIGKLLISSYNNVFLFFLVILTYGLLILFVGFELLRSKSQINKALFSLILSSLVVGLYGNTGFSLLFLPTFLILYQKLIRYKTVYLKTVRLASKTLS